MKKRIVPTFEMFVESMSKVNEGGGAGIQFNATYEDSISISVFKGNVKINRDLSNTYEFDIEAEGYDDSGKIDNLKMDVVSTFEPAKLLDLLKRVKFVDLVYGTNEGEVMKHFNLTEDELDSMLNKTLFDYSNESEIEVYINIDINFEPMFFAGWTRGSFEVGDIVFSKNDFDSKSYNDIFINDCIFYRTKKYKDDYTRNKRTIIEGVDEIDFLDLVIPNIPANQDFVMWYHDTFENDDFDEDDDLNENKINENKTDDLFEESKKGFVKFIEEFIKDCEKENDEKKKKEIYNKLVEYNKTLKGLYGLTVDMKTMKVCKISDKNKGA